MKLGKLHDQRFHDALAKLKSQPIPLRTAFKLKGIVAKVQEELKKFEEVRQSALEQYGSKDENGKLLLNENNSVQFAPENLKAFAEQLNELTSTEVDMGTLSVSELGATMLTADDVIALDGLLVE